MSPIPTPPAGLARSRRARGRARANASTGSSPPSSSTRRSAARATCTARTVGWIWGSLWSTGRVETRGGLWVFRGMPHWAFRRGGVCVGGCFLTGDDPSPSACSRHEAVHAQQWRRYGLLMPVLYLLAGRDPLRNRFEIEAGLEDGNYVPRAHARKAATRCRLELQRTTLSATVGESDALRRGADRRSSVRSLERCRCA